MPDEGAPHTATWMAFGPSEDIWGARLLPVARANLAAIAKAIAAHEPLKMLVREQDYAIASRLCGSSVGSSSTRSTICGCATRGRCS